jgi:predicted adenine nucleotide alpha hydrolase (AANH) superfamily ATPase
MQILVHVCCAPCFTYLHKRLLEDGHDVVGFFYNPNIHPYLEYRNRLESLEKYAEIKGTKVIYKNDYDIEGYLRGALSVDERCKFCYTCRLTEAAKTAHLLGCDAFTTTLLISPFQKHEMLSRIGEKTADEYGIEFYYEDFREGYRESREIAKALELYMQKYCGCIFSEKERYFKQRPQF